MTNLIYHFQGGHTSSTILNSCSFQRYRCSFIGYSFKSVQYYRQIPLQMPTVANGLDFLSRRNCRRRGEPGRSELHPLAGISWILLSLPQSDALFISHSFYSVQEFDAWCNRSNKVDCLKDQNQIKRDNPVHYCPIHVKTIKTN